MKKTILLIIVCIPLFLSAQKKYTISGYITEKGSKESLVGVSVYVKEYETGAVSNAYGFYSVTLKERDSITLIYSYVGFTSDTIRTAFRSNHNFNIELMQGLYLREVTISAEKKNSEIAQMSSIKLSSVEIKSVPMLFGEKDLFKTLMLLPGVQSGTEGTSGMYVRGGGPDQNLIILDEATIYNANHLLGFFSIFNGDAIKSVELIKGGFPARYGGRLSSIINVNMKEGNKTEYHGEGGVGIIAAHAMVEGPIIKNKSSFMVSARRTYLDALMQPFVKLQNSSSSVGYYFYDLNAKLNYDFGDKNKLYVSGYFGRDKFYMSNKERDYNTKAGLFWQNGTGTLRWNHLFTNKLFSNLSYIFSDYTMKIYMKEKMETEEMAIDYRSGIQDNSLKYDLTYVLNPSNTFYMGASFTYHQFTPSALMMKMADSSFNLSQSVKIHGFEYAFYIEDEINIHNKFKMNPGVRLAMFSVRGKTYFSPEPRINMSYNILSNLAIKTSYAMMNQNVHLMSNSSIGLPTDLWIPSTNNIRPQQSQQVALGLAYDWKKPALSFSLEGYYKKMDHMIAYREGTSFILLDYVGGDIPESGKLVWEDNVVKGQGWSYGMEFLVRRTAGKFTGWIGYTLSWTQQQFDDLNFGKKFYARYDRRHDVSIVLMYSPNEKINLSLTWVYASGNAITIPESIYNLETMDDVLLNFMANKLNMNNSNTMYQNLYQIESYGERNSTRMKAFHHLDVGIQFIKQHKKWKSIWEISVYNVYNHKNAFFYYVGNEYNPATDTYTSKLQQMCIFPIIPSFSYNFQF